MAVKKLGVSVPADLWERIRARYPHLGNSAIVQLALKVYAEKLETEKEQAQ